VSFDIYGLRLIGDREVRYVGQTGSGIRRRLYWHYRDTNRRASGLGSWLRANKGSVEAFRIGTAETQDDALEFENLVIAVCLASGQRLFNRHSTSSRHVSPFVKKGGPAEFSEFRTFGSASLPVFTMTPVQCREAA
jgi:hypothetical protein